MLRQGIGAASRRARRPRRPPNRRKPGYLTGVEVRAPLPRPIDDGGALAMETARFRDIYNRTRLHQALDNRTPRQAYLDT
jgi:transposase InsO family protein